MPRKKRAEAEAVEVNETPEVTLSLVGVEEDPDEDIIKDAVDAIAEAVTDVIYDKAESPATVTLSGAASLPRIGPPADGASSAQLARIVQQRGRVAEAAAALARAAQEKKYAQAEYDTAVASLLSKIDQPNLPGMDLEDAAEDAEEQASETAAPAPVTSDAWRAVTLDELGIVGREAKALTAADITTLGAIADWTRTRSGTGFEDGLGGIKGLGEAGQEKVQAQLDAYWASHPVDAPAAAADDDGAADDLIDDDDEVSQ